MLHREAVQRVATGGRNRSRTQVTFLKVEKTVSWVRSGKGEEWRTTGMNGMWGMWREMPPSWLLSLRSLWSLPLLVLLLRRGCCIHSDRHRHLSSSSSSCQQDSWPRSILPNITPAIKEIPSFLSPDANYRISSSRLTVPGQAPFTTSTKREASVAVLPGRQSSYGCASSRQAHTT